MPRALSIEAKTTTNIASLSVAELTALNHSLVLTVAALKQQLEWFKRQLFGNKRERYAPTPDPTQMHLGEVFPVPESVAETRQIVPAHTRRVVRTDRKQWDGLLLTLTYRRLCARMVNENLPFRE